MWTHLWGRSQRPYQCILIHVGPLHLLGLLARQYHGPAQYVQILLGKRRQGSQVHTPIAPSLFCLPAYQQVTRGRSHTTGAHCSHIAQEARRWEEGERCLWSHLRVNADGSNGRDLEIVTCEGRGGRGGSGWYVGSMAQGLLYPVVCRQPWACPSGLFSFWCHSPQTPIPLVLPSTALSMGPMLGKGP